MSTGQVEIHQDGIFPVLFVYNGTSTLRPTL
jgi:hypothetical protein